MPGMCGHWHGTCDCQDGDDYRACKSGTCDNDHDKKPGCKIHRRYQAKRKPRVACEQCWRMWFSVIGTIPGL